MENKDKIIRQLESRVEELEKRLSISESSFMNIVGRSRDGIVIVDGSGCVVYANNKALRLFSVNIADFLGEPVGIPVQVNRTMDIDIVNKVGEKINLEVSVVKIEWEGKDAYLFTLRDVSERKQMEAALGYLSRHDALTGLPNRRVFEDVLHRTLKQSARHDLHLALLFLDIDRFKDVNDQFGHSIGDKLLKNVSSILRSSVRENDLVVRLGGDEFAVILGFINSPKDAAIVAQKIVDNLIKPMNIAGHDIHVGTSIGIAIYPFAGTNEEDLVKNADAAMYIAKNDGGNQFRYYRPDIDKIVRHEVQLEDELLSAIHRNEFYMLYQPLIDLKSNKIMGIESLLRWNNKKLGNVPLNEFLPVAEKLKLMDIIGCLTLTYACDEYLSHSLENLMLSINMSMSQLVSESFIDCVIERIQKYKMKPENLSLEITESTIMKEPQECIKKLELLSKSGVRLLIDDYGSGYTSLSYLQKMPISFLKIDQLFMKDVDVNIYNAHIVQSTIALAHRLGLKVIAEGVETKAQAEFLKRHECDYAQGFYYAEPVDMPTIKRMIG